LSHQVITTARLRSVRKQ